MISSGMKRGLAASAVSALAVAGLPFLASSASALTGDSIAVASVGPVLNGGDMGGVVVLKTKNVTAADLKLVGSDLTSSPNTASQTVAIKGSPTLVANGASGDSNKTDGLDEITMHVTVTTANAGDAAKFAVYEDENASNTVDAAEARQQVSMTTSGALSKIDVSPASQSAAQGIESGDYNVTLQDAAGRTTQLMSGDTVAVSGTNGFVPSHTPFTAAELELGTGSFTGHGPTVGTDAISVTSSTTPAVVGKATLNVTKAADVTADEVDIVTGADSWDGFNGGTNGGTTAVRVDQSSIRIDFKGDDKNSTVSLNVAGNGITFGGKPSTTVSTVLDANGMGSITITPDAGTVQDGDSINVTGSFAQTLQFERATTQAVMAAADPYFSALKGSVDVTAKVVDQFGMPVTTGFVEAARSGQNNDATPQRKAVGSDGTVTFTFTDAKATNGSTDTVNFGYFPDQFASAPTQSGTTHIKYTTDGMGSDFKTMIDGADTEASTYKASDHSVVPLADAYDDGGNDDVALSVINGEAGSSITVAVDNGALLLPTGVNDLSKGKSTITDTVGNPSGVLTGYNIVGTKSGLVTVTVTSAHRTETTQIMVAPESDTSTARNVTVSGPAEVEHGTTQIPFTAVVTDAFGNPVAGVSVYDLNIQVSGPAQFQDSDVVTNAAGQLVLNVRVGDGASGPVTLKVTGLPHNWTGEQFGAAADRLDSSSTSDDAKGLPASANVATATTNVKDAPVEPTAIDATLTGTDNGAKADKLKVTTTPAAGGASATLYKFTKGVKTLVRTVTLGAAGGHGFKVADTNGEKATKYVVEVDSTSTTDAATSNNTWVS